METHHEIQDQYNGFLKTPLLWKNEIKGLHQFNLPPIVLPISEKITISGNRLGKCVEEMVFHSFKPASNIEIIAHNIQVNNKHKITLGELDCILLQDDTPIHMEIVYKFYLYDENVGNTELDHWIGPNRRDSLVKKLTKLKDKQLPLLFKEETISVLEKLHLNVNEIDQQVYFKAQLFVPYNKTVVFDLLNQNCLKGFFIHEKDLLIFKEALFYFPTKIDWLVDTHNDVEWLNYEIVKNDIKTLMENKIAPLCWVKESLNSTPFKLFIVWW